MLLLTAEADSRNDGNDHLQESDDEHQSRELSMRHLDLLIRSSFFLGRDDIRGRIPFPDEYPRRILGFLDLSIPSALFG